MKIKFSTILTTGVALAFFGGINYVSYKDSEKEFAENFQNQIEITDSLTYKKELLNYFKNYENEKRQNLDSLEKIVNENLESKRQKLISKYTIKAVKIVDYLATPGREYFLYEKVYKDELKEKHTRMINSVLNRKTRYNSKQ